MRPAASKPLAPTLETGLRDLFGLSEFRAGQREIMDAVVAGDDTLVIMPTGAGKSLCYQLPAFVREGVTLVVSPLIALMKDQVDALEARGLPAAFVNSSISTSEQNDRIRAMERGELKLVYVAPERFQSRAFLDALSRVHIGLLAIDEAHCISQWGHDFRPDYRRLGEVRVALGEPTTMALTATATPVVQEDILAGLGLSTANLFVRGFERPNLFFEVFHSRGNDAKIERVVALMEEHAGQSGVVYCATRRQVDEVADALGHKIPDVGRYHGGLGDRDRDEAQDAWMSGARPVLVATNAFGMGVDKSDVRAVVHYNVPGSLEAYYQEAGRAGRDGKPANCLMLFNHADRGIHEFFTDTSFPARETVLSIWEQLRRLGSGTHAVTPAHIARKLKGVHVLAVETVFRSLRYHDHIDFGVRDGRGWVAVTDAPGSALRIDWAELNNRRRIAQRQLEDVVQYASTRACRPGQIVRYFGGEASFGDSCGSCDACSGAPSYAMRIVMESGRRIRSTDSMDIVVKKLLAGVARTKGRWGAHVIGGMLRGSRAKKVLKARLDTLSTHGIMASMKQDDIVYLLDVVERHGLVARNTHGSLSLTQEGGAVMRGEADMPASLHAVLEVTLSSSKRRAAPAKAKSTAAAKSSDTVVRRAPKAVSTSGEVAATYLETLQLLNDGRSYDEIARRRDLTLSSVLRHMLLLTANGYAVDVEQHADAAVLGQLREVAADWSFGDPLSPLIAALDPPVSYTALKLNLCKLLQERQSGIEKK